MPERMYHVDLYDFRDWLVSHSPLEIVGEQGNASNCPMRNYLYSTDRRVTSVYKQVHLRHFFIGIRSIDLEPKAFKVVRAIDQFDSYAGGAITARDALGILNDLSM